MIEDGQKVTVRYKIFAEDGTEAASNYEDDKAQDFFIGRGQLMPALENHIVKMEVGDKKIFKIKQEDAFGEVIPELVKTGNVNKIPEKLRVIGNIIDLEDAEGNIISARIHAIEGNKATLDFNHPLAGQDVTFEVELLAVN